MARELKEIIAELKEWQENNSEARSFVIIAGQEEDSIHISMNGSRRELIENVATEIIREKKFYDIISDAIKLVVKYANEKYKK